MAATMLCFQMEVKTYRSLFRNRSGAMNQFAILFDGQVH